MTGKKSPLKVLLVEDESIIAMHIASILVDLGYMVTGSYRTGEDALNAIDGNPPDILLLDIRLQGELDGIETARLITARHDIPVVYITAHSDRETLERAKTTEPYGYILKPVNESRIYTEIELAYNNHMYLRKLRESNDRYEVLFNSGNDSVCLLRLDGDGGPGQLIEVNDITCQSLKYSRAELLTMSYIDMVSPGERERIRGVYGRLEEGKRVLYEVTHVARDGTSIPCEVSARLFLLDNMPAVQASARDITDRRRAEAAYRESQERYRLLFEMMHSGFCLFQPEFRDGTFADLLVLEMNNAMVELLGMSRMAAGMRMSEVLPVVGRDFFDAFERMLRTGVTSEFTAWSEALQKWLFITPYFIAGERIACIVNDITEELRSEQEMRLKDSAIESSISGIVIADLDGVVTYVNRSFIDMWEFHAASDILGRRFVDVFGTNSGQILSLKPLLDRGQIIGEITLRRENGVIRDLKYAASLINDRESNPIHMMSSFIDITEQKRLEKEIMRISEVERQTMGQDLHDGLGQKLTGVAFLVEALRGTMAEKGYPELSELEEIKLHVEESIEQTRKIAKGLCPVTLESFGLVFAIDELAADISRVFKIHCRVEKKGIITVRDNSMATNLFYIVREAVNNAIRHGKPSAISISLLESRRKLTVTIEDDGTGQKRKHHDKGMGLMIMRYRAHLLGGEFEAYPGEKGFLVRVTIPNIY